MHNVVFPRIYRTRSIYIFLYIFQIHKLRVYTNRGRGLNRARFTSFTYFGACKIDFHCILSPTCHTHTHRRRECPAAQLPVFYDMTTSEKVNKSYFFRFSNKVSAKGSSSALLSPGWEEFRQAVSVLQEYLAGECAWLQ